MLLAGRVVVHAPPELHPIACVAFLQTANCRQAVLGVMACRPSACCCGRTATSTRWTASKALAGSRTLAGPATSTACSACRYAGVQECMNDSALTREPPPAIGAYIELLGVVFYGWRCRLLHMVTWMCYSIALGVQACHQSLVKHFQSPGDCGWPEFIPRQTPNTISEDVHHMRRRTCTAPPAATPTWSTTSNQTPCRPAAPARAMTSKLNTIQNHMHTFGMQTAASYHWLLNVMNATCPIYAGVPAWCNLPPCLPGQPLPAQHLATQRPLQGRL